MASGINRVQVIGNLGKDPEVRYSQSGTAMCSLRLAVGERRKDGDGWKDHTEWVSVATFGKTAENAGQYLEKGRQVYVEGKLRTRSYKDKDGNEKWVTEVVADQVLFLGGGSGGSGGGKSERSQKPSQDSGPPDGGFADDDLPF
jgi:single-strand DNA-binding protein